MNKEIKDIKAKAIPVLKEYNVSKAGIFGSYARGEQTAGSDVDFLINVDDGIDLIELIRLKTKLQKAIKKSVDIVQYDTIRKELKKQILNEEVQVL